jgi:hypothetical protein
MTTVIKFGRGPDRGPRDTRSDKGKRRSPVRSVKKAVAKKRKQIGERRKERKELASKKSELEKQRIENEIGKIGDEKLNRTVNRAVLGSKVLGGVAAVGALSTRSGRKAVGKIANKAGQVVGRGTAKGIEEGSKIAGQAAVGVGKGFVEGSVAAGRNARQAANVAVQEKVEDAKQATKKVVKAGQETVQKVGEEVQKAKTNPGKKIKDDIAATQDAVKKVVKRDNTPKSPSSPTPSTPSPQATRSKSIKERLKSRAAKDRERRKKMLGFSEAESEQTIEFAKKKTKKKSKKKTVKVKSYRRKDGTVVRASNRQVETSFEQPEEATTRRIGKALHNLGVGVTPLASAAATAAGAYGTYRGAQDRYRITNRELSAIGESRKFLALGGNVGRLSSLGLDRRKMRDRERRTDIYAQNADYAWAKLRGEQEKFDYRVGRDKNK